MESFQWTDRFITGLPTVDEQHRHLVDLINRFSELLSNATLNVTDVQALLSELTEYAAYHFKDEDEFMSASKLDPRHLEVHRAEHSGFMADVSCLAEQALSGDLSHAESLLDFLVHWLAYHILVQDQNMARQVAAIRVGTSPSHAYDEQQRAVDAATEPLTAALSGLFHQVSAQNRTLLELNQSLEATVDKRTQALSEANLRLEEIASTDVLTSLPNRRHGMLRLRLLWNQACESGRPLACLMIDADDFKQINDRFGHDAGDVVLKALAQALNDNVRTDDSVCRLGGDEFMVLCPHTDLEGAVQLGEQLRSQVSALCVQAGQGAWHGSISIGAAVKAPGMSNCEDLVKAADTGVYSAKHDGRNCVRVAA